MQQQHFGAEGQLFHSHLPKRFFDGGLPQAMQTISHENSNQCAHTKAPHTNPAFMAPSWYPPGPHPPTEAKDLELSQTVVNEGRGEQVRLQPNADIAR